MSDQLTPEEEHALKDVARIVVSTRRLGRIFIYVIGGILGTVILVAQAWDAIKHLFGKI